MLRGDEKRAVAPMDGCVWTQSQINGVNLPESEKFHLTVEVKMLFDKSFLHICYHWRDTVGSPTAARSDQIPPNSVNSKTTAGFSFFLKPKRKKRKKAAININSMDDFNLHAQV